jgi:hypothetical protein
LFGVRLSRKLRLNIAGIWHRASRPIITLARSNSLCSIAHFARAVAQSADQGAITAHVWLINFDHFLWCLPPACADRRGHVQKFAHVPAEQTVDLQVDLYPIKVSGRRGCGPIQNAAGGIKDAVRGKQPASAMERVMSLELILIIVVLFVLFGGGGYWGRGRGYW